MKFICWEGVPGRWGCRGRSGCGGLRLIWNRETGEREVGGWKWGVTGGGGRVRRRVGSVDVGWLARGDAWKAPTCRSRPKGGLVWVGMLGEGGGVEIAFAESAGVLRDQVREAALDHEAFAMPLRLCELGKCRATCCHDGVYVDALERRLIEEVVGERRELLGGYDWRAAKLFQERGGKGKTATVGARAGELAEDFPKHFPQTRCVFLDAEHRCVLQRLAVDEGRHPWFWKPVSCWMHPLLMRRGVDGRPVLTLARPGRDPAAADGYPGFGACTPCGMPVEGGRPAWEVLRGELELLGKIGGRDLVGELAG